MCDADTHIVVVGKRRTVEYAVRDDGSKPAKDFLDALEAKEKAAVVALLSHLAEVGEEGFHNRKRFRQERPPIWAIKRKAAQGKKEKSKKKSKEKRASRLIRLPCFRDGDRWIITHGFWKPPTKSEWPEEEFTLAFKIMNEQLSREEKEKEKRT